MSAPRIEIDLGHLHHNAAQLVARLGRQGITVTAVGKAVLGLPEIVATWLAAGVPSIGDARLDTLERLVRGGLTAPTLLIRTPMLSQVERVVAAVAVSCNSEAVVLEALAAAAQRQGKRHGVLLMVELGDLREGVLPQDLPALAQLTLNLPWLELVGIGGNLGCQHGVAPDATNMAELSALAEALEARFGIHLQLISGGNSANLPWLAGGGDPGRINHLRLGEALLLGQEPLGLTPIPGLHTDAFRLVGELIEVKTKPSQAWGRRGLTSFSPPGGAEPSALSSSIPDSPQPASQGRGPQQRVLVALGHQDGDPAGLEPPAGMAIVGASSDHLVLEADRALSVGEEIGFRPSYSALLRAMTSPFVQRRCLAGPQR
ncbi:MAG: alanine/ornithine racemase family PLP-dependent enzyme [Cyanobacteria bacterium J06638_7]